MTKPSDIHTTIPVVPPALLPGRTANYWILRSAICVFVALAGLVGMLVGSNVPGQVGSVIVVGSCAWTVFWGALCSRAGVGAIVVERRERAAGYTTLFAGQYRRYWQLDPKTGAVVRRPGERQ